MQLTFDPEAIRRDHHHTLSLEARVYGSPEAGDSGAVHLLGRWQKMFAYGWDELWFHALGVSRTGYVLFPEEASVGGDALWGPFANEYTRRLGALDIEFRFSLLRDVFKIGIFHDAAAYGAIDRGNGTERGAVADSFGLGLHLLLIDEFQLDAYFGVGFSTRGNFDQGGSLNIHQAF